MVSIMADSTCDLSEELIKKYGINIIPLHVIMGDEDYLDGINITPDKIYEYSDATKTTPKTAAPDISDIMSHMEKLLSEADELVCFGISSEMSSSVNNMIFAAEELGVDNRVYVIDSRNLSTGIGLLVIKAAELSASGMSGRQIYDAITGMIPKVSASFVVDTMTYLYRGGRCNGLAALIGSALKIHPMIYVSEGKMDVGRKYWGKYSGIILNYVKDREEDMRCAQGDRVFITHSGCDQKIVDEVYEYLTGLGLFEEVLITRAGGVVSSHCGLGTLGVLFIRRCL